MKEIRYIVVCFYEGVGYTYQEDDKIHIFFHHNAVCYKKLGHAKNRALDVAKRWVCNKVCVFKVELGENLSFAHYNDWKYDSERNVFEI